MVVVQLLCSSVVEHCNSNTVSLVWFPATANLHCPYTVLEVSECLDNGEHYVATAISPVHDVQPTFTALIQFLKLASWMLGQWWPLCCMPLLYISSLHDVQPAFTALIQFLKLASWMLGQWWPLCCHCYIISDVLIFKTSHAWWWAQDWNFMFGFWKGIQVLFHIDTQPSLKI